MREGNAAAFPAGGADATDPPGSSTGKGRGKGKNKGGQQNGPADATEQVKAKTTEQLSSSVIRMKIKPLRIQPTYTCL